MALADMFSAPSPPASVYASLANLISSSMVDAEPREDVARLEAPFVPVSPGDVGEITPSKGLCLPIEEFMLGCSLGRGVWEVRGWLQGLDRGLIASISASAGRLLA